MGYRVGSSPSSRRVRERGSSPLADCGSSHSTRTRPLPSITLTRLTSRPSNRHPFRAQDLTLGGAADPAHRVRQRPLLGLTTMLALGSGLAIGLRAVAAPVLRVGPPRQRRQHECGEQQGGGAQ
jgi:hypothetical protein